MSKNVIISEGGRGRIIGSCKKLKTSLQNSGSCLWVPEDDVQLESLYVHENGTYRPEGYGFGSADVHVVNGSFSDLYAGENLPYLPEGDGYTSATVDVLSNKQNTFTDAITVPVYNPDFTYIVLPANTPFLYLKEPSPIGSQYLGYVIADVECRCFLDHYMQYFYTFTFVTDNPGNATDGWNHFSEVSTYDALPPTQATRRWANFTFGIDGKRYGKFSCGGKSLEYYEHLTIPIVGDGTRQRTAAEAVALTYGPDAVGPFDD